MILSPEQIQELLEIVNFAERHIQDYEMLDDEEYEDLLDTDNPEDHELFYHTNLYYKIDKYLDLLDK